MRLSKARYRRKKNSEANKPSIRERNLKLKENKMYDQSYGFLTMSSNSTLCNFTQTPIFDTDYLIA